MITLTDLSRWIEPSNQPMLSVYLIVDPGLRENQAGTPAWRCWLKTALGELESSLDKEQLAGWREICQMFEDYIASYFPNTKTLVFLCDKSFLQTYELPMLLKNYVSYGEPALTPLLYAIKQHQPYLLIFSDHESARIWLVALNHIEYEEERRLEWHPEEWRGLNLMPATSAGGFIKAGSHRDRFSHRVDEQIKRFYRGVADRILRLALQHHIDHVVLAGNEESSHELHRLLSSPKIMYQWK